LWQITMAGFTGSAGMSNYFRAQGLDVDGVTPRPAYPKLLDVGSLTDYMVVHYWTGELDGMAGNWGLNNYICAYNRVNPDGFKFFKYDSEWSLDVGFANNVTRVDNNTAFNQFNGLTMHGKMVLNEEYRIAFADRVHKHFFYDGIMTPSNALALFRKRTGEIESAIIAESARWGDARTPDVPRTKDDDWLPDVNTTENWILNRTATVLGQLRTAGWYPALDAPVFSQHGGIFSNGFQLGMTGPGTIVYTLDGTDPREILTGAIRGTLYTNPVPLAVGTIVKARATTGTNAWSALNQALFVGSGSNALRITEVMYNPRRPTGAETNNGATRSDFEFIEIRNTGPDEIGLAGVQLIHGVSFDFTGSSVLSVPPMGHVVVVKDLAAFSLRYNTNTMLIAGEFSGSLDNGGEQLELVTALGETLAEFSYSDSRGWPKIADGAGHSLVPLLVNSQTNNAMEYGENWRACTHLDGSPGEADPAWFDTVLLNEIQAHTDYNNPVPPYDQYDSNDGIELYNTTAGSIGFADWYLSDDKDDLKKWSIPGGLTIGGHDWRWFTEVDDFHFPITSGFGLNKAGETVYLSYLPGTAADRVADAVEFEGQANGVSWGRFVDGSQHWYTCVPTVNAANALVNPSVVINEFMYHPAPTAANPADNTNDEYIELCNVSGSPVNLFNDGRRWRVNGGVEFEFPTDIVLGPNECLVLVSFDPEDPDDADETAEFLAAYHQFDGETELFGPYAGKLGNSGDRIALERPQAPDGPGESYSWILVDEVIYVDHGPWPAEADGTGAALQRGDVLGSGNDPATWYAPAFASPGLAHASIELLTPKTGSTLLIPFSTNLTVSIVTQLVAGAISEVQFWLDGALLFADSSAPYEATLDETDINLPGNYTLQARLVDAGGTNVSREIQIECAYATRVRLAAPADGQGLISPFSTNVIANVQSNLVIGAVNNVEFFLNGTTSLAVDVTPPYETTLNTLPPGAYSLTAVMSDDFKSSTSPVVNITVYTNVPATDLFNVPDHFARLADGTRLDVSIDYNGLPSELVTVEWIQQSGPGVITFDDPHALDTGASFSVGGVYVVDL
ncbi:MAG: lamin tail domain-containing protein, partial [Verrucomicrobiota bacterium]